MSELNENLIRVVVGKDPNGHPFTGVETPLTLRDFFAAFALLGVMSNSDTLRALDVARVKAAKAAYDCADAMLAERVKEQK